MNELPHTASSSRAYFSISSLRDSCQSYPESKHFTFIHTYELNTQTDRQANTCVHKHNSKGERQSSSWHPRARCLRILLRFRFHSLVCSAAYSRRLCVHLCQLVCSATPACVWMFLFRWHECLFWWIPVFALHAVRDDTLGYVIVLFFKLVNSRNFTGVTGISYSCRKGQDLLIVQYRLVILILFAFSGQNLNSTVFSQWKNLCLQQAKQLPQWHNGGHIHNVGNYGHRY